MKEDQWFCDDCDEVHYVGQTCEAKDNLNEESEPDEEMSLTEKYEDAKNMIDGVYEIVEIYWKAKGPYNRKFKKEWLRKAKDIHGATPMP